MKKRLFDIEWKSQDGKHYVEVLAVQDAMREIVLAHANGEDMSLEDNDAIVIAPCHKDDRCQTCQAFMYFAKIDEGHLE